MVNYLTVPGAAHTMWNVAQWQVLGGWGYPADESDMAFSKAWETLSGKSVRPVSKKDFGVIMRMIHHIYFATVVWCMRSVISLKTVGQTQSNNCVFNFSEVIRRRAKIPNISDTEEARSIIEQTFEQYFSARSLRQAKNEGDIRSYNLMLRLRDLATYEEADQATKRGDIGRLILMFKRWSVMAHGAPGLLHYARHIPRLVLLLEHYLPLGLAYVIKHSMMVSARGMRGRFEAKDLVLEHKIFWLKYFLNRAVRS